MLMLSQSCRKRSGLATAAACLAVLCFELGAPTAVHAQTVDPATQLYVKSMGVNFLYVAGYRRQPIAAVEIVDGNGLPVNGAMVVGNWSGCFNEAGDSALTQTYFYPQPNGTTLTVVGLAEIYSQRTFSCGGAKKTCYFTFTITGVILNGRTYVPVIGYGTSWSATPCF